MPNEVNVEAREAAESAPPPRSHTRAKIALVAVVLLLAAGAFVAYLHYRGQVSSDDAEVDGHIDPVAPKISGTVIEVLVDDNQPVKTGQVLVRIDPRDYQAQVDLAKAKLAKAESELRAARVTTPLTNATTESGVSSSDAQLANATAELERSRLAFEQASGPDLAYAQANVRSKQADNDRAQADLARMKPLADKAEISQQQYDAYLAAAKVAESDLQAAQQKVASAQQDARIKKAALDAAQTKVALAQAELQSSQANRKQVDIRVADVGTAEAVVEQERADLANAELQLSYTTIAATSDGVVTHKTAEVGEVVAPGQGLLAIVPLQGTWVTANFKETQLADVHPGQRAEIHVDMYGRSVEGKVDSIAGATGARLSLLPPENATGNFVKVVERIPVKILVDSRSSLILRPGMNVDVTIYTK